MTRHMEHSVGLPCHTGPGTCYSALELSPQPLSGSPFFNTLLGITNTGLRLGCVHSEMSCARSTLSITWPQLPDSPQDARTYHGAHLGKFPSESVDRTNHSHAVLVVHTPRTSSSLLGLPFCYNELQPTKHVIKPGLP